MDNIDARPPRSFRPDNGVKTAGTDRGIVILSLAIAGFVFVGNVRTQDEYPNDPSSYPTSPTQLDRTSLLPHEDVVQAAEEDISPNMSDRTESEKLNRALSEATATSDTD